MKTFNFYFNIWLSQLLNFYILKSTSMKNNFLVFILLVISFSSFSQKAEGIQDALNNRKGNLFFNVGGEYRITPLPYDSTEPESPTFFTNVDFLHSGPALSIGLEYFIRNNLSVGLDHTLSYDTLLYDINELGENFAASKTEKELLHGFHLYFSRYFKISSKNESEIFIRLGISSFNGGSQFLLVEPVGDDGNGNPVTFFQSQVDFVNFGPNFAIGYRNKRISILAGVYLSNGSTFFRDNFRIVTPYIKLTYTIGKL